MKLEEEEEEETRLEEIKRRVREICLGLLVVDNHYYHLYQDVDVDDHHVHDVVGSPGSSPPKADSLRHPQGEADSPPGSSSLWEKKKNHEGSLPQQPHGASGPEATPPLFPPHDQGSEEENERIGGTSSRTMMPAPPPPDWIDLWDYCTTTTTTTTMQTTTTTRTSSPLVVLELGLERYSDVIRPATISVLVEAEWHPTVSSSSAVAAFCQARVVLQRYVHWVEWWWHQMIVLSSSSSSWPSATASSPSGWAPTWIPIWAADIELLLSSSSSWASENLTEDDADPNQDHDGDDDGDEIKNNMNDARLGAAQKDHAQQAFRVIQSLLLQLIRLFLEESTPRTMGGSSLSGLTYSSSSSSFGISSTRSSSQEEDWMRFCVCTWLACDALQINPSQVDAAWTRELSDLSPYHHHGWPPPHPQPHPGPSSDYQPRSSMITTTAMPWSYFQISLLSSPSLVRGDADPRTAREGPAPRSLGHATRPLWQALWTRIQQAAGHGQSRREPPSPFLLLPVDDSSSSEEGDAHPPPCVEDLVLNHLGGVAMASAIREHFFGRDVPNLIISNRQVDAPHPQEGSFPPVTNIPRERLHLGRVVRWDPSEPRLEGLSKPPYQVVRARLHTFLAFVARIKHQVDSKLLDELLPICYALLQDSQDVMIGLGAAALYHLLNCSPNSPSTTQWDKYQDSIQSALEIVIKTCRHGPTLAMIGRVQVHLLRKVSDSSTWRQRSIPSWMYILDRNRHRTQDDDQLLIWGVLVGAIVPLLFDLARPPTRPGPYPDVRSTALGVEVGRTGLASFLSILPSDIEAFDVHSDQVQLAALVALGNLLVAAYPIMPRHAGKLMCTLVGYVAYCRKRMHRDANRPRPVDANLPRTLWLLGVQVAAMSLVAGGSRAWQVLEELDTDQDQYDADLRSALAEVRREAKAYLEASI